MRVLHSCIPGRGDRAQMDAGSDPAGAASTLTSMKSHSRDQVHGARGRWNRALAFSHAVKRHRGLKRAVTCLWTAEDTEEKLKGNQTHQFLSNVLKVSGNWTGLKPGL